MTMECMDRQALAGFVHSFNQSIRAISILLSYGYVDPKVTFIKREKYDPPQASRYFIRLTHARSSYGSHSLNLGVLCYAFLLSSNIIF